YPTTELGEEWEAREIPADYVDLVEEKYNELVEAVADVDDEIMDKYLEGEEISEAELKAAIRRATISLQFYPVLAGSAYKDKGVQMMLDAAVEYLPSPLDVKPYVANDPETGEEI